MLFNLPLNRDACLNYGNQLTSHLLIRMVTGSQWKIVENIEMEFFFQMMEEFKGTGLVSVKVLKLR